MDDSFCEHDDQKHHHNSNIGDLDEAAPKDKSAIRNKLSNMSFEDLQKLKSKIGSKLYNKTVLGATKKNPKTNFKRANKNRPREMSSKRKHARDNNSINHKKSIPRDPRFDPLCGSFDNCTFRNDYKFINGIRKQEKTKLEKELEQAKDASEKEKIKYVLHRLNNQIREQEKTEIEEKKRFEEKLAVKQKLKSGERPTYKKKSTKRVEDLISKYEELKKTNKLQKYIEKRSRKIAVKERRNFESNN